MVCSGRARQSRRTASSRVKAMVKPHSSHRKRVPYSTWKASTLSSITTSTLARIITISAISKPLAAGVSDSKMIWKTRVRRPSPPGLISRFIRLPLWVGWVPMARQSAQRTVGGQLAGQAQEVEAEGGRQPVGAVQPLGQPPGRLAEFAAARLGQPGQVVPGRLPPVRLAGIGQGVQGHHGAMQPGGGCYALKKLPGTAQQGAAPGRLAGIRRAQRHRLGQGLGQGPERFRLAGLELQLQLAEGEPEALWSLAEALADSVPLQIGRAHV